ncbi:putative HTH-type transcriptional regulator YdfH [Pigmentiphaga humi]|uniref:Putative HTH-type transcriptional regulator YdfH n=1 Tax=Pigmentiphaga humi TaxID=2478468 RepID=A0A3P4B3Z9_9BURK|nr:GntR family transcriptional regulator [Pigmentiphaga humi]VCU70410.1 putative HTH-type transcriptional regulator YdfH [Pigmentiphaga humi]
MEPSAVTRSSAFLMAGGEGSATSFRWLLGQCKTLTLPEQIAAHIGDRILNETIAPGEWVREQDIADEFGVSRSPVREAMRLLEKEGIVRIHPRRGAQATQLSTREVEELLEVRVSLIRLVARRVATAPSPELLAILEDGVAKLAPLADDPQGGDAFGETLARLTLCCAAHSGNDRLFALIASLSLQMFRYTRIGLHSPERRKRSLALWRKSLQAFRRQDADEAERLWARRLEENSKEIRRQLASREVS